MVLELKWNSSRDWAAWGDMAEDTNSWLEQLGLGRYAALFAEQEITLDALWHLTEGDLKEMGLPIGPRRIVSAAIASRSAPAGIGGRLPGEVPPVEPERRQLTVMFCDLVGSTALSQRLDPEDLRDLLSRFQDAVAEAVKAYGGYVARHLGDGVLSYFGWPLANENQSESAVWAGLDAVTAVSRLTASDGSVQSARIGIASGLVIVGDIVGELSRDPESVTGETPNLAARLQALALPGEVMIDSSTRSLVADVFAFEDHGRHELKGFAEPVPAWKVIGEGSAENRFEAVHADRLAPFVGRSHELGLVRERWEIAREGEGQVVLFCGEPGMGKSRFIEAFGKLIADEPFTRLSYQCSPHHRNRDLFPAIQQIRRTAGIDPADDNAQRLDKLETLFGAPVDGDATTLQLFASLLSIPFEDRYGELKLSPQQQREQTIEALVSRIIRLSDDKPVLFLLEDAHWIDPTTEMLVSETMQRIANQAVLGLVTYRPSYEPPWPGLANQSKLFLNRLSKSQSEQIVRAVGGKQIPEAAAREIVERSDGIPLFVEELTKSLVESGDFADIPGSLQVLLIARIDRLGDAKKVLQLASVIGRPFDKAFIRAVGDYDAATLDDAMDAMLDAGLLVRTLRQSRAMYRFKHALIQDVAYETLLRGRRRDYHGRVAEVLLRDTTPETIEDPELVAYHLSHARQFERSTQYWLIAGRSAGQRSAHREAIANLERGLEDLSQLPASPSRDQQEFEIRTVLGASLLSLDGWSAPRVADNYERARALCENSGDTGKLFIALRGQANVFFLNGRVDKAYGLVTRLVEIAEEREETALMLDAYRSAGMCKLFSGTFAEARDRLLTANGLYDRDEHHALAYVYGTDPAVLGTVSLGWANWFLGDPAEARSNCAAALALAEELEHPFSLAYAHCLSASLHQFRRSPQTVAKHASAAAGIAAEHGYTYWRSWAEIMHGWADAAIGDVDAGIKRLTDGHGLYESTGARQISPYVMTLLAEMHGWDGAPEQGLAVLRPVIDADRRSDVDFFLAESLRLAGQLSAACGHAEAAGHFDRAIDLARKQGATMLEIRALVSAIDAGMTGSGAVARLNTLLAGSDPASDEPDLAEARRVVGAAG